MPAESVSHAIALAPYSRNWTRPLHAGFFLSQYWLSSTLTSRRQRFHSSARPLAQLTEVVAVHSCKTTTRLAQNLPARARVLRSRYADALYLSQRGRVAGTIVLEQIAARFTWGSGA